MSNLSPNRLEPPARTAETPAQPPWQEIRRKPERRPRRFARQEKEDRLLEAEEKAPHKLDRMA
jgi:hypothetical protein